MSQTRGRGGGCLGTRLVPMLSFSGLLDSNPYGTDGGYRADSESGALIVRQEEQPTSRYESRLLALEKTRSSSAEYCQGLTA